MKIEKETAVALLTELGSKAAHALTNDRLAKRLQKLPDILDDESGENVETPEAVKLLKKIQKDPSILEDIEIVDASSNGHAAKKAGKKAAKPEVEEEEDNGEEEAVDETEEEDVAEDEDGEEAEGKDEEEEEDVAVKAKGKGKKTTGKGKAAKVKKAGKKRAARDWPEGATMRVQYDGPRGTHTRIFKNTAVAVGLYRQREEEGKNPKFLPDRGMAKAGMKFENAAEAEAYYEKAGKAKGKK